MAGRYGITNANQIIDQKQIEKGCDQIDQAAKDFVSAAAMVEKASALMNRNALSIDDATLQNAINEVADAIKDCEKIVNKSTNSIRGVAQQVHREQSGEYSAYLRAKEEEAKRKAAQKEENK